MKTAQTMMKILLKMANECEICAIEKYVRNLVANLNRSAFEF